MALTPFASPVLISGLPSAALQKFPEAVTVLSQKTPDAYQSLSSIHYDAIYLLTGEGVLAQRSLVLRLNTRTCNPQYLLCETSADQTCACTLISRAMFYKLFLTLVSCGLDRGDHCECRPTPVCCGTASRSVGATTVPCSCEGCQSGKMTLNIP